MSLIGVCDLWVRFFDVYALDLLVVEGKPKGDVLCLEHFMHLYIHSPMPRSSLPSSRSRPIVSYPIHFRPVFKTAPIQKFTPTYSSNINPRSIHPFSLPRPPHRSLFPTRTTETNTKTKKRDEKKISSNPPNRIPHPHNLTHLLPIVHAHYIGPTLHAGRDRGRGAPNPGLHFRVRWCVCWCGCRLWGGGWGCGSIGLRFRGLMSFLGGG